MAGFQFAHIQTYSKKGNGKNRSIAEVLAENSREPDSSLHVENPQKPNIIFGINPVMLLPELDNIIKEQKIKLIGTGKKIREDTHVLMTSVMSYPIKVSDINNDVNNNNNNKIDYEKWRDDAIEFIKSDFENKGLIIKSIIEHNDETYPHLHVLAIADNEKNARLDVKLSHPGHAAKAACTGSTKEKTIAYKEAMRGWQDLYFQQVAMKNGQARIGPRKRRLTRAEWQNEQKQMDALVNVEKAKEKALYIERKAKEAVSKIMPKPKSIEIVINETKTIFGTKKNTIKSKAYSEKIIKETIISAVAKEQNELEKQKKELEKLIMKFENKNRNLDKKEDELNNKENQINELSKQVEKDMYELQSLKREHQLNENTNLVDVKNVVDVDKDKSSMAQKRVLSSKNTLKL